MTSVATSTHDSDPALQELLEDFGSRAVSRLTGSELRAEWLAAGTFLAVVGMLALLLPGGRAIEPGVLAALVVAYAVASRVEFQVGAGYTVPTELVFVPMLFLAPLPLVPLLVSAGIALAKVPDYVTGRTSPDRLVLGLGDSWHAVGPVLVLGLAHAGAPELSDWWVYALALTAQLAFDLGASTARVRMGMGVAPRLHLDVMGWVYLVDLLLAPVGLVAALACTLTPYAFLLVLPLAGLLAVFARDRRAHIESALELSRAYRGTALLLGDVVEADDAYTGSHSRDVVELALEVADELGLDARERRRVEFGALLHDVGKIAVPNEIINKPGKLDDEEWAIMKRHTILGQGMLERVGGVLADIGVVVRASHERHDGKGYPDGLAGEEIPIAARIISCCDAFSAMTTDRSYRKAMPLGKALAELEANAGTQFDPVVAAIVARLAVGAGAPVPERVADASEPVAA